MKIRAEIHEIENIRKEKATKSKLILKDDQKIDKPLASLSKKKREKIQITKVHNERGDITSEL